VIYKVWARMLRCLIQHALKILNRKGIDPYEMLYASEVVANVERMLIEMFSGNESLVPRRYWDHFGVVDGIYERGFPSFDKYKMNFERGELNLRDWPRTKEERNLIFMQCAGVKYNFSTKVWSLQMNILSRAVGRDQLEHGSKQSILGRGGEVVECMVEEWSAFICRSVETRIGIERDGCKGLARRERIERERALKGVEGCISECKHILSKRQIPAHCTGDMANMNLEHLRGFLRD